jgi:putative FmdB family regulatory protein
MPTYEYECRKCGVFDYEQSIVDPPLGRCPKCRSKVTKLISAPAFHLKGGGWYADGYEKKPSGGTDVEKPPKSDGDSAASSGDGGKTPDAKKPATKEASAKPKSTTAAKAAT